MKTTDILIIGGGASGLAAAIEAARTAPDKSVTVLEHLPKAGKKILATGNGRCNLGNLNAATHKYTNAKFALPVIEKFAVESLVDFFESMGLYTRADSEGRLYPMSNSAASVLDALRFECDKLGINIICEEKASQIKKSDGGFTVNGNIQTKKLIIATGGKSSPSQGSDGSGYPLLKSLGHTLTQLSPSLVQLKTDTASIKSLKGVRSKARLTLSTGGSSEGEILFTDYGVSGIAAMDLSRFIKADKKAVLSIDLLPDFTQDKAKEVIIRIAKHNPAIPAEGMLGGIIHKAIGTAAIKTALGFLPKTAGEIKPKQAAIIAATLKDFRLKVTGTKSYNDAQVTRGGADVNEFDNGTMMSKKVKNLYACGEVLNVDGACGGFNLAWAFASGRLAGKSAAQ
ncbi:MAG: aminoacetone oxidase family FAD-binding enzyme [Clostridia bacterium]|nr:aminoacetone oxidase family FAD-binding enzyme [Clostridia bacterium]